MLGRKPPPPPLPPAWLPPSGTAVLDGIGEVFYRDSGPETAQRGTLLLLHGWTVTADLNWIFAYRRLVDAGFRVIALDHRGHGRGLRAQVKFRLEDCARDAARLVGHLQAGPVTVVGYSMGGAIAQLIARDHRDVASGLVLCATASHWTDPRDRVAWFGMRLFQWVLRMFSRRFWRGLLRQAGRPDARRDSWILGELSRGSADDIAEAGRELGRFDSRPWVGGLQLPASVVIPDHDRLIPPERQHELARAIPGARVYSADSDHSDMILEDTPLVDAILAAVSAIPLAAPAPAPGVRPAPTRPEIA